MNTMQFSKNGKSYMGVADVAKQLKLSEETIRRKLRGGLFKGAIQVKGTWWIPEKHMEQPSE
jgi:hypothetical protein